MTPYKGFDVLLEAMKILQDRGGAVQLMAWVANLDKQPAEFQDRVRALLSETQDSVVLGGPFEPAEVPRLLASVDWLIVPSIWWEVGPNTLREAMTYRRPVICSDIGAMAERVTDGVNGLQFRAGDSASLADTIQRAVDDPDLWERLVAQIEPPPSLDEHRAAVTRIYEELLSRGRAGSAVPA
jgi:glycosyltransferase involved in cell wall biosynthesis